MWQLTCWLALATRGDMCSMGLRIRNNNVNDRAHDIDFFGMYQAVVGL